MTVVIDADQVVIDALTALNQGGCKKMFASGNTKLETALEREVCKALSSDERKIHAGVRYNTLKELACSRSGGDIVDEMDWTRPPGGVDIVAELADGSGLLLMELKVCKPEEAPWDALKLADIGRSVPGINAAYLVYAARKKGWSADLPGADLLLGNAERRWGIREMIVRWPGAWVQLLRGGKGIRPLKSTAKITVTPVAEVSLDRDKGYVVRAVRVASVGADKQEFDPDGWPIDYDPPDDLRALGHAADELLHAEYQRVFAAEKQCDCCHGHPWPENWNGNNWSDPRLDYVISDIGDDAPALKCFVRRWKERGFSDQRLRKRFGARLGREKRAALLDDLGA